jgi:serotype a capsulation locus region II DNA
MYDLEEYEGGRGLYFGLDEYLYGRLARNKGELVAAVREEDMCADKRAAFGEKFMSACDGNSREKVSKWIFDEDDERR